MKNILPDILEIALNNISDYNLSTLKVVLEFDRRTSNPVNVTSAGGNLLRINLQGAGISEKDRTLTGNRKIRIQLRNRNMVCRNLKVCCDAKGRPLGHLRGRLLSAPAPVAEYCCRSDNNKNITSLSDDTGAVCAAWEYDAYGNIVNQTGEKPDVNPLRFSSEYHDEELGLVYYNYRHYNPKEGRWISRDPIEESGGINLYSFVDNKPIFMFDVKGEEPKFALNSKKCTLTMKLKMYHEPKGSIASKVRDRVISDIYKVWNQMNKVDSFVIMSHASYGKDHPLFKTRDALMKSCPCAYEEILPKIEIVDGSAGEYDIFLSIRRKGRSHANPMDGYQNFVLPLGSGFMEIFQTDEQGYSNFQQHPLLGTSAGHIPAHEFGHSLGLLHPGHNIVQYTAGVKLPTGSYVQAPYVYKGKDIYGNDVDGNRDLMGKGMEMRKFYWFRWLDILHKKYKNCCYGIERTIHLASLIFLFMVCFFCESHANGNNLLNSEDELIDFDPDDTNVNKFPIKSKESGKYTKNAKIPSFLKGWSDDNKIFVPNSMNKSNFYEEVLLKPAACVLKKKKMENSPVYIENWQISYGEKKYIMNLFLNKNDKKWYVDFSKKKVECSMHEFKLESDGINGIPFLGFLCTQEDAFNNLKKGDILFQIAFSVGQFSDKWYTFFYFQKTKDKLSYLGGYYCDDLFFASS